MKYPLPLSAAILLAMGVADLAATAAFARGGGSNFMNSPGYQRRLQESRGQVTNQSGSLFSTPQASPSPARKVRRHGKR